jgi:hypothetical protein
MSILQKSTYNHERFIRPAIKGFLLQKTDSVNLLSPLSSLPLPSFSRLC